MRSLIKRKKLTKRMIEAINKPIPDEVMNRLLSKGRKVSFTARFNPQ